jgi:PAS domain S-box-containing protein
MMSLQKIMLWRAVCENATAAMFMMNRHQHCVYMNPAAESLTGYTLEEVEGRPLHDVIHHTRPDGSPYPVDECPIDRAFPTNTRQQGEETFIHKDGSFYPVAFTASPLRSDDAEVLGTIIEVKDLREAKAAERRRLEDARLIEATFENAAVGIAHVGANGDWLRVNRRLCEIVGYSNSELVRMSFQDLTHPDDLQADLDQFGPLMRGEIDGYRMEKRYRHKDGTIIWISLTTSLQRDNIGNPLYCISVVEDITQRKEVEQRLKIMARELDHRVKNTLQIVQVIAKQSMRGASDPETATTTFLERLSALSTVHGLLLKDNWSGLNIATLLEQALQPFGYANGDGDQISFGGPVVWLGSRQAQTLSMAVHELATNAAKYGSLSKKRGLVRIAWDYNPADGTLSFRWAETGGPAVTPPQSEGFGTVMLTSILGQDFEGTVNVDYAESGFTCHLTGQVTGI